MPGIGPINLRPPQMTPQAKPETAAPDGKPRGNSAASPAHQARAQLAIKDTQNISGRLFGAVVSGTARGLCLSSILMLQDSAKGNTAISDRSDDTAATDGALDEEG